MKNFPWGIIAGIFAILWSFITIAIITVFVVSGIMIADVGGDDGLRESWWLIPLYVGEAVTLLGFAASIIFYIRKKRRLQAAFEDELMQKQGE